MNDQPCQHCAEHYKLAQSLDQQAIELRKQRNLYRAEAYNVQKKLEHEQAQFHRAYTDMTKARADADKLRGEIEGLRAWINTWIDDMEGVADSASQRAAIVATVAPPVLRQVLDRLDANPPECERLTLCCDGKALVRSNNYIVGSISYFTDSMMEGDAVLFIKLPKRTP